MLNLTRMPVAPHELVWWTGWFACLGSFLFSSLCISATICVYFTPNFLHAGKVRDSTLRLGFHLNFLITNGNGCRSCSSYSHAEMVRH